MMLKRGASPPPQAAQLLLFLSREVFMKLAGFGLIVVLACLFACISACTAVVLALDHTASHDGPRWVDEVMVTTGATSAACALAAIRFQIYHAYCGTTSRVGVALAAAGAAAHTTTLAALSLYWSCFYYKSYYSSAGLDGHRRTVVQRQVNYFDYYQRWSDEEVALYALGCLAGVSAWLLALVASVLNTRCATKQLVACSMPLATYAASFMVPLVPEPLELAPPHTPSCSGETLDTPRLPALLAADTLLLPSKAAATLFEDKTLLQPNTHGGGALSGVNKSRGGVSRCAHLSTLDQ